MWFSRQIVLGVLMLAAMAAAPASAQAGWPLEGSTSASLVGFGESYVTKAGTSVHHGVDLAGHAGEQVLAPRTGKVTFVGRVPGAGGTTVLALTLLTSEGSITLLPLDRATVSRGDEPSKGDPIATLADAGDASSSATHLHVGLRAGGLYLDPATILSSAPAAVSEPQGAQAEVEAPAAERTAEAPTPAGSTVEVQAGVGEAAGGAVRPEAGGVSAAAPGVSRSARVPGALTLATPTSAAMPAPLASAGHTSDVSGVTGELAPGVSLVSGSDVAASGFEPTGVVAETGEALSAGSAVVRAASSAVSEGRLGVLAARGIRAAKRGARSAALAAIGVMCALGALWPLWRAGGLEGPVKVPVSAVREDVAAVASR